MREQPDVQLVGQQRGREGDLQPVRMLTVSNLQKPGYNDAGSEILTWLYISNLFSTAPEAAGGGTGSSKARTSLGEALS